MRELGCVYAEIGKKGVPACITQLCLYPKNWDRQGELNRSSSWERNLCLATFDLPFSSCRFSLLSSACNSFTHSLNFIHSKPDLGQFRIPLSIIE